MQCGAVRGAGDGKRCWGRQRCERERCGEEIRIIEVVVNVDVSSKEEDDDFGVELSRVETFRGKTGNEYFFQ